MMKLFILTQINSCYYSDVNDSNSNSTIIKISTNEQDLIKLNKILYEEVLRNTIIDNIEEELTQNEINNLSTSELKKYLPSYIDLYEQNNFSGFSFYYRDTCINEISFTITNYDL